MGTLKLGVGHDHANTPVLILIDASTATVTHHTTGEVLGTYNIEPEPNKRTRPMAGFPLNNVSTHL